MMSDLLENYKYEGKVMWPKAKTNNISLVEILFYVVWYWFYLTNIPLLFNNILVMFKHCHYRSQVRIRKHKNNIKFIVSVKLSHLNNMDLKKKNCIGGVAYK